MLRILQRSALLAIAAILLSCGGSNNVMDSRDSICNCVDSEPDSADFRHAEKHIPLPSDPGVDISVATILSWPQGPEPANDAPRTGRELQMFHIPRAFLQFAWLRQGDCDLHLEIADSPSKTADRVIVETPNDDEYCSARMALASALKKQNVDLGPESGEITPVPVDVLGLAFQDFNHKRGTDFVKTVWELHPAIVTVLSQ